MAYRVVMAALFAAALPLSVQVQAQTPSAACPVAVPAAQLASAMAANQATTLPPGTPVRAGLHPASNLNFAIAPERVPLAGTYGGFFVVEAASAGTYRVSINSRAWLDVIQNGKAARGNTHGHPGGCTLFTKQVEFTLQPGRTLIQLSGNPEPVVALLVEKVS